MFWSYKKLAIFTTKFHAENQTLINHTLACRQVFLRPPESERAGSTEPPLLPNRCYLLAFFCPLCFLM
jgi:hypothetical protein